MCQCEAIVIHADSNLIFGIFNIIMYMYIYCVVLLGYVCSYD
jgi:hypothetical protein